MKPVREEFAVHLLNRTGKERAAAIAECFSQCLDRLQELCGTDGWDMAVVRMKLKEACFFAKRTMARRPENQEPG